MQVYNESEGRRNKFISYRAPQFLKSFKLSVNFFLYKMILKLFKSYVISFFFSRKQPWETSSCTLFALCVLQFGYLHLSFHISTKMCLKVNLHVCAIGLDVPVNRHQVQDAASVTDMIHEVKCAEKLSNSSEREEKNQKQYLD